MPTRKKLEMTSHQSLFRWINRAREENQTAKCWENVHCAAHGVVNAYHNWQKEPAVWQWTHLVSSHYARNMLLSILLTRKRIYFLRVLPGQCYLHCLLFSGNAGPTARNALIALLRTSSPNAWKMCLVYCLLLSGNAGATARNARIALLKVQIALDVMRSLSIQALVHWINREREEDQPAKWKTIKNDELYEKITKFQNFWQKRNKSTKNPNHNWWKMNISSWERCKSLYIV